MAAVDTLLTLALLLLYLVKALLDVLMELRQLLEAIELELDASRLGLGESLGARVRPPPE